MPWPILLTLYRLLLPMFFLTAFPGWWVKMLRRGGFRSGLGERAAFYRRTLEFEPCHATHVHAISVGEVLLALKLIRQWREDGLSGDIVLATGTATGHQVAKENGPADLRVTYAPLDFRAMTNRYLDRFEPRRLVLIEGEVWPHLILACERRNIPVDLVNARMSPRTRRRFTRFASWLRPVFSRLAGVSMQDAADRAVWQALGVPNGHLDAPGSLKFDPASGPPPIRLPRFSAILETLAGSRPIVLLASTHDGEEAWLAEAVREAVPATFLLIVPRHAERRADVARDLIACGWNPILRSGLGQTSAVILENPCLVVDTTGELKNWTAHADLVVIGKSFLAHGGQNPSEAIQAGKPLVLGPFMENFEPLASELVAAGGALQASNRERLKEALKIGLDPVHAADLTDRARQILARHEGATRRLIRWLERDHPAPPQ